MYLLIVAFVFIASSALHLSCTLTACFMGSCERRSLLSFKSSIIIFLAIAVIPWAIINGFFDSPKFTITKEVCEEEQVFNEELDDYRYRLTIESFISNGPEFFVTHFLLFLMASFIFTSLFPVGLLAKTSNDPYVTQWAYEDIGVYSGWDITTGSHDVVVAIIDNGFDTFHPDLIDNAWKNTKEISDNRIDDDGNGYVDDVWGWNFMANDTDGNGVYDYIEWIAPSLSNQTFEIIIITSNKKGDFKSFGRNCR